MGAVCDESGASEVVGSSENRGSVAHMTQIVASVMASTTEEMIRAMREATAGADLVEARVDSIREPDLALLKEAGDKPIILTCRSSLEGGLFQGSEGERLELLRRAFDMGFDFVDVETSFATPELLGHRKASRVILSHHVFDRCPSDLACLVHRAVERGADMVKLAVHTSSLAEAKRLADAGREARERGIGYTPVALGPSGVAARILASKLGADFTYASARGLPPAGPGQLDIEALLTLYHFRTLGEATRIYGIVGCPAAGSLSPAMHNAWFARQGLDAVYVPFEEENLESFVSAARDLDVAGLSVTMPHKQTIASFLDEVDPLARRVGAVNTILARDGKWIGFNTDIEGVIRPISERIEIGGKQAVILGAGGAARAAAFGLAREGANLAILARRYPKAAELADVVGAIAGRPEDVADWNWDILVNATPVGGGGLEGKLPAPLRNMRSGKVVLDMVYEPEMTALLEMAESDGAIGIPGLEMLVAQACCQAEIWTGTEPSSTDLEVAARAEITRRQSAKDRHRGAEQTEGN